MDIPWGRMKLARTRPSMALADSSLDDSRGVKLLVVFNPADAEKLFEGSGHSFQEIADLAKDRKPLPTFPLTASIQAKAKLIKKQVESDNIIAKLPGTDPKLKDEYVVLSAHMDHLGIGEPINGDRIYNGAMDNGSGSALVLDIANSLHRSHARPEAFGALCVGHGRGEGPAWFQVLRHASDRAEEFDRGRHQYRHVPADLSR